MLELNHRPTLSAPRVRREASKQPRRLLLALALLVIALVAVILRDSQFWFGSDDASLDGDSSSISSSTQVAKQTPAQPATVHAATKSTPASAKKSVVAKGKTEPAAPAAEAAAAPADSGAIVNRTVLPPMDVEIVAGDNHRVFRPGNNATKVEISKAASAVAQSGSMTNAADREPMAVAASIPAQGSYESTYPLLAQHMNVQGSVVLQAVIGADGIIENMRVLAGPAILASAAQQAVREWHFKPIVQNGQPVESKARITVNFTIRVADSSANPTLAESRAQDIRVLSR